MKQYIGTKIINAKPMNRLDYNVFRGWELPADENGSDEGYLVEYVDGGKPNTSEYNGYVSWSPKEQFYNAYKASGNLSFGDAIVYLKLGGKVKLPYWAEDVFITIQTPTELSKMTAPYLYVTSRFGLVPWNPTQIEILSANWEIV